MSYTNETGDRRSARIGNNPISTLPTVDQNMDATNDDSTATVPPTHTNRGTPDSPNTSIHLESQSYNDRIDRAREELNNALELNQSRSISSDSLQSNADQPAHSSVAQYLREQQETMTEMRNALQSLSARLLSVEKEKEGINNQMLDTIKETFANSLRDMERATREQNNTPVPQVVNSNYCHNPHTDNDVSLTTHQSESTRHETIISRRQIDPEPSLSSVNCVI